MKTATLEISKRQKMLLYSDPEFAALMWQEVEADPLFVESDDVSIINMEPGDIFSAEYLGFEYHDNNIVINVDFKHVSAKGVQIQLSYIGWIPNGKITFKDIKRSVDQPS